MYPWYRLLRLWVVDDKEADLINLPDHMTCFEQVQKWSSFKPPSNLQERDLLSLTTNVDLTGLPMISTTDYRMFLSILY